MPEDLEFLEPLDRDLVVPLRVRVRELVINFKRPVTIRRNQDVMTLAIPSNCIVREVEEFLIDTMSLNTNVRIEMYTEFGIYRHCPLDENSYIPLGYPLRERELIIKIKFPGAGAAPFSILYAPPKANVLEFHLAELRKVIKYTIYNKSKSLDNLMKKFNSPNSIFFRAGKLIPSSTTFTELLKESSVPLLWFGVDVNQVDGLKDYFTHDLSPKWDEATTQTGIPFLIDETIKTRHPMLHKNILQAIKRFHDKTIIRYCELNQESDINTHYAWIKFYVNENLTCSSVGRNTGENPILLFPKTPVQAILHELMHTLGFVHEHQRADRDLFVKVSEKVKKDPDYLIQSETIAIGSYDPKSIMHYHYIRGEIEPKISSLMSKEEISNLNDPRLPTDFSDGDIQALHIAYGTKLVCTFEKTGLKYTSQGFYECETCWGQNSRAGCCVSCSLNCHKGHKLIYHNPGKETSFCDCGVNGHRLKCTRNSSKENPITQPLHECLTCNEGPICFPCSRGACERNHSQHSITPSKSNFSYCRCKCCLSPSKANLKEKSGCRIY